MAAPASKFWGMKGAGENWGDQKSEEKNLIFCHFYAEIIKFGLILVFHYFFWGGGKLGERKHFWEKCPHVTVVPPLFVLR